MIPGQDSQHSNGSLLRPSTPVSRVPKRHLLPRGVAPAILPRMLAFQSLLNSRLSGFISGLFRLACCGAVSVLMIGCGGTANFGEAVVVAQEKHTRLDDPLSAGTPITLPGGAPFNVADAQRFSSGPA